MYQKLQSLKQGVKIVDDYTTEFYQLMARNEVHESEDQMVARYIGGLKVQIQDTVNLLDPVSVSEAHQRVVKIERQQRRPNLDVSANSTTEIGGHNSGTNTWATRRLIVPPTSKPLTPTRATAITSIKCFDCGEVGHRERDCKKACKRENVCRP
ncbi:PREDICTED: uncharacterized protein LOC109330857 [Lupinus angustifolius]|uniref:uncharacterized protein LOC109330857 n=1 Tax=Lupinus angustifolius TaxID=3871 RepID=UPI00092F410A|nr:PREDICTED: uncharacterized protein LOC109330857 [Lupinus angustifolius]